MIRLSKEQVVIFHSKIIAKTGGEGGLIHEALLESALLSAVQTYGGRDLYSTTIAKIARITHNIIKNHPFVDGNKRTATHVMVILLSLNSIEASFSNKDMAHIGEAIANGTMNHEDLAAFILERC